MLSARYDLRAYSSGILNQGAIGSCAPHAMVSTVGLMMRQAGQENIPDFSPMQPYADTRIRMGTFSTDSGSIMESMFAAAQQNGIAFETSWAHTSANLYTVPTPGVYAEAAQYKVGGWTELNRYTQPSEMVENVKQALSEGKPVILAFSIRGYFDSEQGPLESLTGGGGGYVRGGHAVTIVGYDDSLDGGSYIVQNSWGTGWGDGGYGIIRYDQFTYGKFGPYQSDLIGFYTINQFADIDFRFTEQRLDVAREYAIILGRAPEITGLDFWAGLNLDDAVMADYLIASAEGALLYGNDTSAEFVTDMYREALGRAPDAGGLAFWSSVLDAGSLTRGQVFCAMADSAEATQLVANKENLAAYMAIAKQSDGSIDTSIYIDMVTFDPNYVEVIKVGIPDLNA